MAHKSIPERRAVDRRVRQVYHDLDRRSGTNRRVAVREVVAREERQRPGFFTWTVIALVALFLVDAVAWKGYYRHALWVSINAEAASLRDLTDSAWRPSA